MFKKRLDRKLHNYHKTPRERFTLLAKRIVTEEEFVLLEFLVAISGWDEKYEDSYGVFAATNQQIAEQLGWKSDTSVLRHKEELLKKGFIEKLTDGYFRVKHIERWLSKQNTSHNSKPEETARMHNNYANMQKEPAKMQGLLPQNGNSPLVSSKGSLDTPRIKLDEDLSDEIDQIIINIDNEKADQLKKEFQKSSNQINPEEQRTSYKGIFGEGTRWADEK